MNAPKPINAMKHFGGGPEYGGKKKPGEINYIAKMAFLCLAVMTVVCLFMHHTNDSLQQNDNLPAKPLQRPIGAYIQADVTSVELEHVAEGKITTCTVEGEVLDLLRKWTNNLQPVETSTGKWTIDFETGNTPEQMEWIANPNLSAPSTCGWNSTKSDGSPRTGSLYNSKADFKASIKAGFPVGVYLSSSNVTTKGYPNGIGAHMMSGIGYSFGSSGDFITCYTTNVADGAVSFPLTNSGLKNHAWFMLKWK